MQCKAVTALPSEGNWTFEIKFDGYRCLAVKNHGDVKVFSRNENVLDARFPRIAEALKAIPGDFAIDGEIVALDDQGCPSFQLLQNSRTPQAAIYFYAFDLLNFDGEDIRASPIEHRRRLLHQLLDEPADPLRLSPLLEAPGPRVLEAVRALGLEGVVGKREGSIYQSGDRSGAWIKHRTENAQEFVIGGYIPGNHGFDALLIGLYEGKQLNYAAKVRNGFVSRVRTEIFPQLKSRRRSECPFRNLPQKKSSRWGESLTAEKMKECRWVKPDLVCQVAFVQWTDSGHLRHCKFVGMRDDKKAATVVRET